MNAWKSGSDSRRTALPLSGDTAADARHHLRQLAQARATWLWVISLLAVQAGFLLLARFVPADRLYSELGLSRAGVAAGRFWQVLTYGWVHGSWLHAGLNAVFFLWVGGRIEQMVGARTLTGCAAAGILAGGLAHVGIGVGLLVGMSGGCLALLLLLTTLSPQSRMWPLPVSGWSLGLGLMVAELFLALVHPGLGVPGFAAVGVWLESLGLGSWFTLGHACHFGGGLAGWLVGRWILRPRVSLARLQRQRARREARRSGQ